MSSLFEETVTGLVVSRLNTFDALLWHPWHKVAEALASLFDLVLFAFLEHGVVVWKTCLVFFDPVLGELASLNVLKDLLHVLLHLWSDDA